MGMAKIVLSDSAPSGESIHFTFAEVEFDLGGSGKGTKKSYSTEDRTVLSNASAHPWLEVEFDPEAYVAPDEDTQVRPENDSQSAAGPNASIPFDADEIRKIEEAKLVGINPTAIDANLDQNEPVTTGPVAETVAADNDAGDKS